MIRTLIAPCVLALTLAGCVTQSYQQTPLVLTVDPFVFEITDTDLYRIEAASYAAHYTGAHLEVGDADKHGFGLSKVEAEKALTRGPSTLKVGNREFLEMLIDFEQQSAILSKYRKAFDISPNRNIAVVEKADWLFIAYGSEVGAVAYGATDDYQMAFSLYHNEGFEPLVELLEGMRLK